MHQAATPHSLSAGAAPVAMLDSWLGAALAVAWSLVSAACWSVSAVVATLVWTVVGPLSALLLALLHATVHPLDYWTSLGVADDQPYSVPLLGSFAASLLGRASFQDDVDDLHRRHVGRRAVGAFGWRCRPCLLLRDPDLVEQALNDDEDDGCAARGLGAAPRDLRERLSPLLLAGRVDATARLMVDCADQLVQSVAESAQADAEVEVLGPLCRFSTGVTGSCAFGVACNCIEDPDWELHHVASASRRPPPLSLLALAVVSALPSTAPLMPSRLLYPAAVCFYVDMMTETAAFRERTRTRRQDFVNLMAAATRCTEGVGFLSDKDRRHHCALAFDVVAAQAFVLHAHTHVPRTVARCLLELARRPALQRRAAAEVQAAVERQQRQEPDVPVGSIGLEVLQNTPFLEQVLLEALRLCPPCGVLTTEVGAAGFTLPTNKKDSKTDAMESFSVRLRSGTRLYVSVRALHRDPELYPDPLRFDPERFAPNSRRSRPRGAYIPFGELVPAPDAAPSGLPTPSGLQPPAQSTGAKFAFQEMWLCLASLLVDLEFSLSNKTTDLQEEAASTLNDELWLRVQRRSVWAHPRPDNAQWGVVETVDTQFS